MAKKRNVRKSKTVKEEEPLILDEKERRSMEYMFLGLFGASIVFLMVYLAGFISILLR